MQNKTSEDRDGFGGPLLSCRNWDGIEFLAYPVADVLGSEDECPGYCKSYYA